MQFLSIFRFLAPTGAQGVKMLCVCVSMAFMLLNKRKNQLITADFTISSEYDCIL